MNIPGDQETIVETGDGHIIAVGVAGTRVVLAWSGPSHSELTVEEARTLGYLLRGYARLAAEQGNEPGR